MKDVGQKTAAVDPLCQNNDHLKFAQPYLSFLFDSMEYKVELCNQLLSGL